MRSGPVLAIFALAVTAGCKHPQVKDQGTLEENARNRCRTAFTQCAPRANYSPETDVDELDVRSLVQITWRLDLPDALCAKAGKRLRKLAEQGDLDTVREIARAGDAASDTLGRCLCEGDRFRPEYEKQRIGEIVAGRLPAAKLSTPEYWAERIDPHVAKLRGLSRRSAGLLATGDDASSAELEVQARKEERALCEDVHAARDVLSADGMADMRALVYKARAAASGEASVDAARRILEQAERQASCAATE